jgi:hypothetical protein
MRECKKLGIPHVSLVDRQELTSWLKGSDAITHGQEDTSIFDPASDIVEPVYKKQKSGADNGMIVETTKTMELRYGKDRILYYQSRGEEKGVERGSN